jgi:hypothetical protein
MSEDKSFQQITTMGHRATNAKNNYDLLFLSFFRRKFTEYKISGSHSGRHEESHLLGHNVVWPVESRRKF